MLEMDNVTALRMTVRVAKDGTVTRGARVRPTRHASLVAAAPMSARGRSNTYATSGGIPSDKWLPDLPTGKARTGGGILEWTMPHDCRNHLREDESPADRGARLAYGVFEAVEVAA